MKEGNAAEWNAHGMRYELIGREIARKITADRWTR